MEEGEKVDLGPERRVLSEMSRAALKLGHFQLAYLLETSIGDICGQLRRELDEFDRLMAILMQEAEATPLAA